MLCCVTIWDKCIANECGILAKTERIHHTNYLFSLLYFNVGYDNAGLLGYHHDPDNRARVQCETMQCIPKKYLFCLFCLLYFNVGQDSWLMMTPVCLTIMIGIIGWEWRLPAREWTFCTKAANRGQQGFYSTIRHVCYTQLGNIEVEFWNFTVARKWYLLYKGG